MLGVGNSAEKAGDCLTDIRNRVVGKDSDWEPGKVVTSLGFQVSRLPLPPLAPKEERHTFLVMTPVHQVRQEKVAGFDHDSSFFRRFPAHRISCGLFTINVARNNAVFPVFIPCLVSPQEKDVILFEQEEVNLRNQFEAVHGTLVEKRRAHSTRTPRSR